MTGPGTEADHQFALWHPRLHIGPGTATARFDATPGEVFELNRGTPELMAGFLEVLGWAARPVSWTLHRFCTPYYADEGGFPDHLDRLLLSWEVEVTVAADAIPYESKETP